MSLSLEAVLEARERVGRYLEPTPIVRARSFPGALKLETTQPTGSFKVRGASNKLLSLSEEARKRGVVTVSTGNHGRAVAWIARRLGVRAVVCISERVPSNKVEAIRSLGAELRIEGDSQDDAALVAAQLSTEEGLTLVHPFDDPDVIAGQGTLALEIVEQLPETTTIVVPLSGGGLASGVALAARALEPSMQIVAVSLERSPVMLKSLDQREEIVLAEVETIADSLLGGIGSPNRFTRDLVRELVTRHVVVSDAAIEDAMAAAFELDGLVLEGAGAAGVAAVRGEKISGSENVVVVASGQNVDRETFIDVWRRRKPQALEGRHASHSTY